MKISLNTGQGDPERDRARARAVGALAQLGHGVPGPGTAGTPAAAAQVASQAVVTIVAEALGSREEQPMRELKTLLLFGLMTAFGCGGSSNNNGGTVQFTASGEVFALAGYDFPRAVGSNNPVFVDGWQIVFDELLVTFDNVTLAENPDKPNQALTDQVVAQVTGPWAIDLHKGGPLPGKGGGNEQALWVAAINNQNKNGNKPFDEKRYAFSFDIVRATNSAQKLNFDATNNADYATMVTNGWTVFYSGTATFRGTGCTTQPASTNYPFGLPPMGPVGTTVKFKFGFASPTSYINCQNPDNSGAPLTGEMHQRGVQIKNNQTTIAQATLHTDHPFWESFVPDSPRHFDQLASRAQNMAGTYIVTLNDVVLDQYTGLTDAQNRALPWRICDPTYHPIDSGPTIHFDDTGLPQPNPSYAAFMTYNQITQGHLNADGRCAVQRHY